MMLPKPPLLFLDIDGVLNSVQYYIRRYAQYGEVGHGLHRLDPDALKLLQAIVIATECEIVISSSLRRIYPLGAIVKMISEQGYIGTPPIIDCTPVIRGANSYNMKRGHEVQAWMSELPLRGVDRTFCCMDDNSDYLVNQPLIRVDNEYGLRPQDAERCINILKRR